MKVLCINSEWQYVKFLHRLFLSGRKRITPIYGEVYEVLGEEEGFYVLKGFPNDSWDKKEFIPIQEETQEEREEIVYEEKLVLETQHSN